MFGFNKLKLAYQCLIVFLFVGVVPLFVLGIASIKKSRASLSDLVFNQLISIRDIKKNQVIRYLQTINDQMITFSENRMVIDAMRDFSAAFPDMIQDNGYRDQDIQGLEKKLADYYQRDFSDNYAALNGERRPDVDQLLGKLDKESIVAQYQYIKNNPNPLGAKEAMNRAADSSRYSRFHEKYHPIIRNYLKKFGYYDIFLVHPQTGKIIYSVFKELDFATSLLDGPYARTHFAEVFRQANQTGKADEVVIADFKPYLPSYDAPAGFLASPIFDGQEKIGVAIFQFPIDILNVIMGERSGMGRTGESYLVGPDRLMRSDSYLDPGGHSVNASFRNPSSGRVDTEASKAALQGRTHAGLIRDYNDNRVLSAFAPVSFNGLNWAVLAEIDAAEAFAPSRTLFMVISSILVGAVAVTIALAFVFTRSLTRPLALGVDFAKRIAQGDLTEQLVIRQKNELGHLGDALNIMVTNLSTICNNLHGGVGTLSSSSTQLTSVANQMASMAEQTSGRASEVTTATELMSRRMISVAAASEQASTNIQMVSAAAEEMSTTISEIVSHTTNGSVIAQQTVSQAKNVSKRVSELGRAAIDIGKVTEAINEISEQTNLLALNATIEAARAGEAGKGFAVVANEIKELARQTATATQDIRLKIESIQTSTQGTVTEISQIEKIIQEVNDIVFTIANAVKEQSAAANEITGNIQQAALGIQEVNENVAESSSVSGDILRAILEVNQAATEIADNSRQVSQSAGGLFSLSSSLQTMMNQFKV